MNIFIISKGGLEPRSGKASPGAAICRHPLLLALLFGAAANARAEDILLTTPAEPEAIVPVLNIIAEGWHNSGGVDTGAGWDYVAEFALEVDTHQLLNMPEGGSLMIQFLNVQNGPGRTFSERTGAFNPASGLMAGDQFRFFDIYYSQSWNDDGFVLKFGQVAADDDFMYSKYSAAFLNAGFGAMPSQVSTTLARSPGSVSAFPVYPVAAPGIFLLAQRKDSWFVQAGAYVGGPGPDASGNHGFEWEISPDAGMGAFLEGGIHYKPDGKAGSLKLGGTFHTGLFDDFSAINAGNADATARGIHSFYIIVDQALANDGNGETLLGAFARTGFSPPADRSIVRVYHDAGLVWNGPFGRHDDALGAAVSITHMGDPYAENTGCKREEIAVELTYRAFITPWMTVQGDVQWVATPAYSEMDGGSNRAFVAGIRTTFSF